MKAVKVCFVQIRKDVKHNMKKALSVLFINVLLLQITILAQDTIKVSFSKSFGKAILVWIFNIVAQVIVLFGILALFGIQISRYIDL